MPRLRPHQGGNDDEEAPEAWLISALLEAGDFTPERYHVSDEMILAWPKVWAFARAYQEAAGHAPALHLVATRFPDFVHTPDVDASYAARAVREKAAARDFHTKVGVAIAKHREGEASQAYDVLESIHRPRLFARQPSSVFDHTMIEDAFALDRTPTPWPTMNKLCNGGIGAGEMWLVAARTRHGKTWSLCSMAARCATEGLRVGYASLEMPDREITGRILLRLAGADREFLRALRSDDVVARKTVQDQIMSATPGSIEVFDPSHGAIGQLEHLRSMAVDYDIVFLDHVQLMQRGTDRGVDAWNVMAAISNTIREISLASSTAIVAAAQINREGDAPGSPYPPKLTHIGGSDALGQDSDVVITQKSMSRRVNMMGAEKVRNGMMGRWYTRFDVRRGQFGEIPRDEALTLMDEDEVADKG